jgi:hypothetical protein
MKEFSIGGYKYYVDYHEGEGRQIVIDKIFIKYGYNHYKVDLNSEAGRTISKMVEMSHE